MNFLLKRGLKVAKSFLFMVLMKYASQIFTDKEGASNTINKAKEKLNRTAFSENISENIAGDLNARQLVGNFIRMLKSYYQGEYTGVSQKTLMVSLAAVVYFILPIDLVPDFIPLTGFIDDIGLLMWVLATYREEISAFLSWEQGGIEEEEEVEILYEEVIE